MEGEGSEGKGRGWRGGCEGKGRGWRGRGVRGRVGGGGEGCEGKGRGWRGVRGGRGGTWGVCEERAEGGRVEKFGLDLDGMCV